MRADYGEVRGTTGMDGDPVDVYVGPDDEAPEVYLITQMKKGDWARVDEQKVMLGCRSAKQAKALYLAHYDDPRFCGAIKEMDMSTFKERLAQQGQVGKKIASAACRIAELNYLRLQTGEAPLLGGRHGVKVGAEYGPAKDWDDDIPPEVKRRASRTAPSILVEQRRLALGETEVSRMEQVGIGVPDGAIRDDPKDSKMRKAAALAMVERFLKTASQARAEEHSRNRNTFSGAVMGGLLGGGLAGLTGRSGAGMLAGGATGAALGGLAGRMLLPSQTQNKNITRKEPTQQQKAMAMGVLALNGAITGGIMSDHLPPKQRLLGAALGALALGGAGYGMIREGDKMRHELGGRKTAAAEGRAARIADRLDDVGIGMLAAPYAAKGLANTFEHRSGRLGAIGRSARTVADHMHKHENKYELGGLSLVAPGIVHPMGKGIDKGVAKIRTSAPKEKVGGVGGAMRSYVRGATRLGAVGALGVAGTAGAGIHGGSKLLKYHPHQGLAAPLYRGPMST